MAEAMDRMKAGMVAAYRDKSGRDDAEIETLMAAETWRSAQEALQEDAPWVAAQSAG
jgi:ATP-dependent protease ClpP protease subunit